MTKHVVSYSEISKFRQCPHAWEMSYKQRWTSPDESPALTRGKLFHSCLENYYLLLRKLQQGKITAEDFPERVQAAVAPFLYNDDGSQTETQNLVEWMIAGYFEHYGLDPDWKIVSVEHDAEVPLPTGLAKRNKRGELLEAAPLSDEFFLKIKIDLIVRHIPTRKLYIVDHKTCANLPTDRELEVDDQFGLYTWGLRQLDRPVWGSIYSASRTQRNKTPGQTLESRFARYPLYRTEPELDMIAFEAYKTAKRAYAIPDGEAERAPDTERCRFRCGLLDPCMAGRKGQNEITFLKDLGFVQNFERH